MFDVLVVESTSVSEENNRELSNFTSSVFISSGLVVLLVTGTVSTVALIVVLTLIAVISLVVLSRKCIGTYSHIHSVCTPTKMHVFCR